MKSIIINTDQNIQIELELASLSQRLIALFIDVMVSLFYLVLMTFIIAMIFVNSWNLFNQNEEFSIDFWIAVFFIIVYVPYLLYSPLLEFLTKGQTIGKMAIGIRVIKANGENPAFRDYFTRWLFRPVEFYFISLFTGFYFGLFLIFLNAFFDILFVIISTRSQRSGGFMSNTVVVRKTPKREYSLKDVLSIKSHETHQATYPNVIQFTDEDMMLIKSTIDRVKKYQNDETKKFAIQLADKTAESIGLAETPEKKLSFLETVLNDYIVLTR